MTEKDYVLGTHDEEIARLGLQHRVWRPRAADAWRRAGFTTGQRILDVGCGPGYASLDLAEIVGPSGRVVSVDRSRRFLDFLEASARERRAGNIETRELDLDESPLPPGPFDGAWARWVFAFVRNPRALLERVAQTLKPGGVLVVHEYFAYATWRLMPPSPEHEELVTSVIESWRAAGGEPDIGMELPAWLEETGFAVRELRPLIDVVGPASYDWQWPRTFIEVGLARMVELGHIAAPRAKVILAAFEAREPDPRTRMATPAVLEIVAQKR